jgi:hypothetical protein
MEAVEYPDELRGVERASVEVRHAYAPCVLPAHAFPMPAPLEALCNRNTYCLRTPPQAYVRRRIAVFARVFATELARSGSTPSALAGSGQAIDSLTAHSLTLMDAAEEAGMALRFGHSCR